jgi:hypothetical protein
MQQDDLARINQVGASARSSGLPYLSKPHFRSNEPWETVEAMDAWHARASAWAGGWLRQDEGRDKQVAAMVTIAHREAIPPLAGCALIAA